MKRQGVAFGAAAATVAAFLVPAAAPTASAATSAASAKPAAAPSDPSATASLAAKASGRPVTVDALTTETSQTVANADGSFTWTGSAAPVRVRRGGAWKPVDASLKQNPDGTLSPAAVPGNLVFAHAGSTTLATMTDESGHALTYGWPHPLPAPTVTGTTALYPNVWPGIDLSLTAGETGSFEDTLIVHSAAAAAAEAPALAALKMPLTTSAGLTASADATGNTKIADSAGKTVFAFGAPEEWDSALPPTAMKADAAKPGAAASTVQLDGGTVSDSHHPGAGAHKALMKATVSGSAVDISADLSSLAGGPPVYPVFLDPVTVPQSGQYGWDEVQQAYPTTGEFNNTSVEDLGVGYQGASCPCGNERAYYALNLPSAATSADEITSATVYTTQDYASNTASSYGTDVYLETSGMISSATTWNNQPGFSWVTTSHDPAGSNNGVSFNVTTYANNTLRPGRIGTWTFMLYSANESGSYYYFKRFTHNPTLSLTYENEPYIDGYGTSPTPFQTIGGTGTCPYSDGGWLSHQSGTGFQPHVVVHSTSNPQNTLGVNFWMFDNTTGGWYWGQGTGTGTNPASVGGANGATVYGPTANNLSEGHKYTWWADAYDLTLENTNEKNTQCSFTVDTVPPDSLAVTSGDFPQSGTGQANKGINTAGSFALSAHDATSGVWCFEYAFDGYLSTSTTPCGGGNSVAPGGPWAAGNASTTVNWNGSPVWGTHFVTVDSVDRAGNRSAPTTYAFYLTDNPNATAVAGDVTGDGSPDLLAVDTTGNLKTYNQLKDPGAGGTQAAAAAEEPTGTWNGALLTHRGSLSGNRWDDLWAWTPNNPASLYLYVNSPTTPGSFLKTNSVTEARPDCSASNIDSSANPLDASFACYQTAFGVTGQNNYAADWHNVLQMTSIGVVKGIGADNNASLVTVESDGHGGANLWLYPGVTTKTLGIPYLLATNTKASWANFDLAAPGDVTGDGVPDLWVRDRTTGTVYTLPITIGTETVTNGSGTLPAPIAGTLTSIGTVNPALYPQITSVGDIDGSGHADLYATGLYGNTLTELPGTGGTGTTTGIGSPVTVTPPNWTGGIAGLEGSQAVPTIGTLQMVGITGKCLDDLNGSTANGNNTDVFDCNHSYAQVWDLESDGTIRPSFAPSKCLDIHGGASQPFTYNGATVDLWDCVSGAANEVWQLRADGSIFNANSGRCLDDPNSSTTNATEFQIYDCNGTNAQKWTFPSGGPAAASTDLWRMDDNTGVTAADAQSHANLALTGAVGWAGGHTGTTKDSALSFTGTTNGYAATTGTAVNTAQSFSVSAWVKLTDTNTYYPVASQAGTNQYGFWLGYDHNLNAWALTTISSDTPTQTSWYSAAGPAGSAQTGVWTHLVGTYDTTSGRLSLYVNGVLQNRQDAWPTPFAVTGPMVIGNAKVNAVINTPFKGSIDQVRVYSSALTPAQVAALYNAGG